MSLSDRAVPQMFVHQDPGFVHTLALGHMGHDVQEPVIAAWFILVRGDPLKGQGTPNFQQVTTWQDCLDFVGDFDRFDDHREAVRTFRRLIKERANSNH
jgi:hypothetical protein